MFSLGTVNRASVRSAINTMFLARTTRVSSSWMAGGVAHVLSPTCMPPLRFGVPSRGFVTILRKPEHPEDTTALEGDVLGVLLTDRAIEVRESFRQQIQKLRTVAQKENDERLGLRVGVEPGGCHGYVYKLELTSDYEEDDLGARVIIDSVSLGLIKGSTIDYVTELIGSQFAIKENPQAKGNGCGCGVSWEPIL